MAKRAFVVGSETEGLAGAVGDARRAAAAFEAYGFAVDLCVGVAATREGILDGYRRLIVASGPDDAALFYYSGHGAFAEGTPAEPGAGPLHAQCLVPVDFHRTTELAFYGVAAQELSLLLGRLTEKTRNVTVVLDCCHAAGMSRSARLTPKALPRPLRTSAAAVDAGVRRLFAERRAEFDRLARESNPHAVRLVATGVRNYAWEHTRPSGERSGAFTDALLTVLDEARGRRVTWEAVGERVRELVLARFPAQRPEAEGPARRLLFDVAEAPATNALVVVRDAPGARYVLRGGRLHGVHLGDEYALSPGATFDEGQALGTATVVAVDAAESEVEVTFAGPRASIPAGGVRAFPTHSAAPRRLVSIDAPPAERQAIARAVAADPLLRAGERGDDDGAPLALVRVEGRTIGLFEPWGQPARAPSPYSEAAVAGLVADLHQMAAVVRLRELESEPAAGLPEGSIEVSWGRVDGSRLVPLATEGELLDVGTPVYVRVRNTHPAGCHVYVSIVDLGVAKRVALLTRGWPSGRELKYGEEYVCGQGADAKVQGERLLWPEGLPEDEPRSETMVVIVAERPRNLLPVETAGLSAPRISKGGSPLEQLVRQVQRGGKRRLRLGQEREGYLVKHIDFLLAPRASPRGPDGGPAVAARPATPK